MGALEGSVECVGEEVGAGYIGDVFLWYVEVGCSPGSAPLEVLWRGTVCLLVFAFMVQTLKDWDERIQDMMKGVTRGRESDLNFGQS